MASNERKKEILAEFFREVWNEGSDDSAGKYLAPKYTIYHDPGDPWDQKELDLAGFQERVRMSRAPFPDQRFEIYEFFCDGDAVVVTWFWSGTQTGEISGFPPSGKLIKMSGATVYYFEGERLRGHWQIADRLGVFMQLRQAATRLG